jgi:hypothetical protein
VEAAAGALAGAITGALGAFGFALLHIIAKRVRNGVLIRRGAAPYRDVVFVLAPWLIICGVIGAIAGAITGALGGAWWPAGVISGAATPALLAVVVVVVTVLQALDPGPERAEPEA